MALGTYWRSHELIETSAVGEMCSTPGPIGQSMGVAQYEDWPSLVLMDIYMTSNSVFFLGDWIGIQPAELVRSVIQDGA